MTSIDEKLKVQKAKSYKVEHDVERLHHLVAAAKLMQDHTQISALQAALVREIWAMNLRQQDLDAEEKAAEAKNVPYTPPPEEEEEKKSEAPRAPSAPRRS